MRWLATATSADVTSHCTCSAAAATATVPTSLAVTLKLAESIHELERRIFNEANFPLLTRRLNEYLANTNASGKNELKQAISELSKVQKQIENIVNSNPAVTPSLRFWIGWASLRDGKRSWKLAWKN
jgi:hypothetical protein